VIPWTRTHGSSRSGTSSTQLSADTSVPRNIRRGAKEAKDILFDKKDALDVRIAKANSILDQLADGPQHPPARADVDLERDYPAGDSEVSQLRCPTIATAEASQAS